MSVALTGLLSLAWTAVLPVLTTASMSLQDGHNNLGVKERCVGPGSWSLVEDGCYTVVHSGRGEYRDVEEARGDCRRLGADLASFPSSRVEELVYSQLQATVDRALKMYIGITDCCDNRTEHIYTWVDGVPLNYSNWGLGEPNNKHKGDEDCTVTSYRKRWQDYPCCVPAEISAVLCRKHARGYPVPHTPGSAVDSLRGVCYSATCGNGSETCMNGGVCEPVPPRSYRCLCPQHTTGRWCETQLECLEAPVVRRATRRGNVRHLEAVIMYECQPTYMFPDKTTVKNSTCRNAIWTPAIPDCIIMKCTAIPSWSGLVASSRERLVGTEVNYTCAEGLAFQDRSPYQTTTCNMSRLWEPPLQPCMEVNPEMTVLSPPVEARGAAAMGIVAVLFMSVELALFVFMDLALIRQQFQVMKDNLWYWCASL